MAYIIIKEYSLIVNIIVSVVFIVIGYLFFKHSNKTIKFILKYLDWFGILKAINKKFGEGPLVVYFKWLFGLGALIVGIFLFFFFIIRAII